MPETIPGVTRIGYAILILWRGVSFQGAAEIDIDAATDILNHNILDAVENMFGKATIISQCMQSCPGDHNGQFNHFTLT